MLLTWRHRKQSCKVTRAISRLDFSFVALPTMLQSADRQFWARSHVTGMILVASRSAVEEKIWSKLEPRCSSVKLHRRHGGMLAA